MAKMYRVYSIIERPKQEDFWLNIGMAYAHEKGDGFNLMLQALPLHSVAAGSTPAMVSPSLRSRPPPQHAHVTGLERAPARAADARGRACGPGARA
jgi:hypothetical protein